MKIQSIFAKLLAYLEVTFYVRIVNVDLTNYIRSKIAL